MRYTGRNDEFFEVSYPNIKNHESLVHFKTHELAIVWFLEDGNQLIIDGTTYFFKKNDIVCLTAFNRITVEKLKVARLLKWDKHFYCVITNDSEVGCKGILFYGATKLPVIHPSEKEIETLTTVWKVLEQEMSSYDNLQEEMLQMILKRIVILCTRIYKSQSDYKKVDHKNMDIIREYNFLVERHFKEKHTLSEYAELLFKAPKTLSNLFKKLGNKTPLKFIQDRKMLEAKRLLSHSEKNGI